MRQCFSFRSEALIDEVKQYFDKYGIICRDYTEIVPFIKEVKPAGKIGLSFHEVNYLLYKLLGQRGELKDMENPTTLFKAVKNSVELENLRKYYLLDSVKLTKFLFWMKKNVGKITMDEYSVAMKLDSMRAEIDGFFELSFPTISAYKENAAMMHYSATETDKKNIEPEATVSGRFRRTVCRRHYRCDQNDCIRTCY